MLKGNSLSRIKAVFLDYTGTMVREDEPYTMTLLKYFLTHSDLTVPEKALGFVWTRIKEIEYEYKDEKFIMKDEIADMILEEAVRDHGLKGDLKYMHDVWRNAWIKAPLFDDVKPFIERSPLPVYVLTNDDLQYIDQSMAEKDLQPAGIVAAEMVRACKPHREIFEKALEMAGVTPEEAIHIGDSMTSDVQAAAAVGITPVLIDRKGRTAADMSAETVLTITSLDDITFPEDGYDSL